MFTTAARGTPTTAAWPKGAPVAQEHATVSMTDWSSISARFTVKLFLMLPPTLMK